MQVEGALFPGMAAALSPPSPNSLQTDYHLHILAKKFKRRYMSA